MHTEHISSQTEPGPQGLCPVRAGSRAVLAQLLLLEHELTLGAKPEWRCPSCTSLGVFLLDQLPGGIPFPVY